MDRPHRYSDEFSEEFEHLEDERRRVARVWQVLVHVHPEPFHPIWTENHEIDLVRIKRLLYHARDGVPVQAAPVEALLSLIRHGE